MLAGGVVIESLLGGVGFSSQASWVWVIESLFEGAGMASRFHLEG